MTPPRILTRRHLLRLAGVTAAGAGVTACSVGTTGTENRSAATSSAGPGSLALPYLFDGDPQAQQVSCRLLAVTPSIEDLRAHEQFMRLAIEQSTGNPSYPSAR